MRLIMKIKKQLKMKEFDTVNLSYQTDTILFSLLCYTVLGLTKKRVISFSQPQHY